MAEEIRFPRIWILFLFAVLLFIVQIIIAVMNLALISRTVLSSFIIGINSAAIIYWFFCVYRIHEILAYVTLNKYPISAGKAVGYSLIPFYNVYWIFRWSSEIANFINTVNGVKRIKMWLPGLGLLFGCFIFGFTETIFGISKIFGLIVNFSILSYLSSNIKNTLSKINLPITDYTGNIDLSKSGLTKKKTVVKWLIGLGAAWLIIIILCVINAEFSFSLKKSIIMEQIYGDGIGIDSRFSFSPDGRIILFDAIIGSEVKKSEYGGPRGLVTFDIKKAGERNIYTINLDNLHIDKLTSKGNNAEAVFSPDGKKITFISNRDGNDEVYIMNADGTDQKRLTNNNFLDYPPSFSPDGSQIVFTRLTRNPRNRYFGVDIRRLLLLTPEDGREHEIAQAEQNPYYKNPEFIDNETITFGMDAETYFVDISETKPKLNVRKAKDSDYYIFSPDRRKVAFTRRTTSDPYKAINEIFVADTEGKNRIQITNNGRCNRVKVFSPDGKKVLFISGPDSGDAEYLELWEVGIDGSDSRRINISLE